MPRPLSPVLAPCALFLLPLCSLAQHSGLGLKAGLLMSDTKSGVLHTEAIPNASAGLYFALRAGDRLEIQPELLLTSLGAGYTLAEGERGTVRTLYVQVPVSAKFYFSNVVNVQAGMQMGRLMMAQQHTPEGQADVTDTYETWDYGLVLGAGADLISGLDLGIRYYNGMRPILLNDDVFYPRNRSIMISAGYRLGRLRAPSMTNRRR
ncbi:MAG: PorT family protein [Flavobacteriales bacterium]|nr:PorT family protein [Flavobacteriales bacterium]